MSKLEQIKQFVECSDTLTNGEKTEILSIIGSSKPWYVIVLEVIKYLGIVAGYFLAGLGLASCTHFIS